MTPTLTGFAAWVRAVMAVPTQALPDDSPFFGYAFAAATSVVNPVLNQVGDGGVTFTFATYNLGGDNLVNWAQDDPDAPYDFPGTETPYWQYLREKMEINLFIPGVIEASADEGTSSSYDVLDQYKTYTLANLQNLKTPWGRAYLGFAADVGPLWGIS